MSRESGFENRLHTICDSGLATFQRYDESRASEEPGAGAATGVDPISANSDVRHSPVSASTAYAVAASLMKRPISDDISRSLFSEYATQRPSVLSWCCFSH